MSGSGSLWDAEEILMEETNKRAASGPPPEESVNLIAEEQAAPLFARAVSAEKVSVQEVLKTLEAESIVVANGLAIQVEDQATYDLAAHNYRGAKDFIERASSIIEPYRLLTYNLYQKVMNRKKAIITPNLETNLKACGSAILRFEQLKEEERRKQQIEDERKAREEEETRRLNMAAAAEKAGMSTESVEAILEAPSTVPMPVAAPTFQKAAGLGKTRESWQAEPIGSPQAALLELVKAAAKKDGKHLLAYLQVNESALNAHARATKAVMQIPGFKAVDKGTLVRSR